MIRAPNHLGDLVMALTALGASWGADILVSRALAPVLQLAGLAGKLKTFDRGAAGFIRALRDLRRGRYEKAILLAPSYSSALMVRAAGIPVRRGTISDHRAALLTDRVALERFSGLHRSAAYFVLVTGGIPTQVPQPKLEVPDSASAEWRRLSGVEPGAIGLFPGSHAASRRWPVERFGDLAARLMSKGHRVVVLGGPQERELTAAVAARGGVDAGGKTDIPLLAAALRDLLLLVSNDSGPMHLAAAVGTPTVSLWGAGDPQITGPVGRRHRLLRHAELPCVPCVKNTCPRSGQGTILADADRECLALITVDEVETAVGEAVGRKP